MYVLSKNRMQIINLEQVTAMYLGADETSIKVDFVTGRGSQIGKYVSDTYAKKALELLILAVEMYMRERHDSNPYLLARAKSVKEMDKKLAPEKMMSWWKNPDNVVDGHLDKSSIEAITRKMAERAGVERANPHKFRRTCATMALRRGMPVEQVSKMLGHENIETTQIYLDLTEDELEQAHRKYVV